MTQKILWLASTTVLVEVLYLVLHKEVKIMIRGTTPTHIFNIPFDTSLVDEVKVTYAQDDVVVLEKHTVDCTLEGATISVTLTQEDTFLFNCKKAVEVQIRVLTINGEAFASIVEKIGVSKCLDNEVLT
jgi:hypothetical protein